MTNRRFSLAAACSLAFISVVSLFSAATVDAQVATNNTPGGISITPAITQIKLQPNENTLTLEYTVTNHADQLLTVSLGSRDFGAFSQNGAITLYGSGYNPATSQHGIQSYVMFPKPKVTIPANSSRQVKVSIQNTAKLAPGGHYGAILFSPQSAFGTNTNSNHIDLNTSVAGLVFLTTAYGGTYGVSASMSHINPVQFKLPNSVYLVFNNTGNTQTIPQGQLTLYGLHSKVLASQVVNPSSGLILSGGSRIFQEQLPLENKWYTLPGVYHLKLQYKDNEDTRFKTLNQTILYINWKIIALSLIALLLVVYTVNKFIWSLLKRITYFRVKRRKLKSTSNTQKINVASDAPSPKVMDVARPKRPKNTQ